MKLNSLERDIISCYRKGKLPLFDDQDENIRLTRFSLWIMLNVGNMIRSNRFSLLNNITYKNDGSPITILENNIEEYVRKNFTEYFPQIAFIGEETGGKFSSEKFSVALDPIDGTWSFVSQSSSYASSLAIFKEGNIVFGSILNPSSGELGYVSGLNSSRLIQLSMLEEKDVGLDLPLKDISDKNKLLINFHPSKHAREIINKLYYSWESGKINFVKSIGGSPSLGLLEAAKGHYNYINIWDNHPSLVYDLAAGIQIVRSAGGEVLDGREKSVQNWGHKGLFVGGISTNQIKKIIEILQIDSDNI